MRASLIVLVGALLVACGAGPTSPAAAPVAPSSVGPSPVVVAGAALPAAALEVLATLPVRNADPVGYTRAAFGQAWADVDRNGCDTRNDVLRRDLHDVVLLPGTRRCVVASGTLHDPYTGRDVAFRRGTGSSSAVQIDHVVSLAEAWRAGGAGWTAEQRQAFANSPRNLLAVSGPVNESKGDDTADEWTPPDRAFACRFAGIVVAVKAAPLPGVAPLSLSQLEHDALAALLARCPGEPARAAE